MIPYENHKLNSKQIERIARAKARERIQKYVRDYGHAPSQELISTFAGITADELERYRQIYYSRNTEKENVGITATVEGWATQTQKVYDEYIRLTYNVTSTSHTSLFYLKSNPVGYGEIDGITVKFDNLPSSITSSDLGSLKTYSFPSVGTHFIEMMLKNPLVTETVSFSGITALREIELPSCINNVGRTFQGCEGLEKIICRAVIPPSFNIENTSMATFKGISKGGVLYVPEQSIDAYKETWLKTPTNTQQTLARYGWTIEPIPD